MMSQPGYQKIVTHILPNILRNNSNQTMKFGQLVDEKQWETIFLKNHTKNVVENRVPDLFKKIKIEHISGTII